MGDILTYSFDAYLLVTTWNSGREGETNLTGDRSRTGGNRQYGVVSRDDCVFSRKTHRRKNSQPLLDFRGMQTSPVGEVDRDIVRRLSKLELFQKNVHPSRKTMHAGDKADRPHKDHSHGICLYETKSTELSGHKRVKFDMNLTVYEIPYEDRVSEWMTLSLDRHRFERRIQQTGLIIEPVLKLRLNLK